MWKFYLLRRLHYWMETFVGFCCFLLYSIKCFHDVVFIFSICVCVSCFSLLPYGISVFLAIDEGVIISYFPYVQLILVLLSFFPFGLFWKNSALRQLFVTFGYDGHLKEILRVFDRGSTIFPVKNRWFEACASLFPWFSRFWTDRQSCIFHGWLNYENLQKSQIWWFAAPSLDI